MRVQWVVVAVGLASLVLLLGASTLLVADSPYDPNVHSERNPSAPDRPATLNRTTVTAYLLDYEQTRLANDLLATRGHMLDMNDDVIASCNTISVSETDTERFRVQLRCIGGIDDTKRLFEPGEFSYRVTYRVTENETQQIKIRNYPYNERDSLRTPSPNRELRFFGGWFSAYEVKYVRNRARSCTEPHRCCSRN